MRNVYVVMDQGRDKSAFVTGNDGAPMERNPFKDIRVREALSLAINRTLMKDRVMNGLTLRGAKSSAS